MDTMKYVYSLLFLAFIFNINAQSDSLVLNKKDSSSLKFFEVFVFSYEQKIFQSNFDHQVKTFDQYSMGAPGNYISISSYEPLAIKKGLFPDYSTLSFMIPSIITINDSVQEKMNGYSCKLSILGKYIIHKKNFDCFAIGGIEFGRTKLTNDKNEKLKNPFFAPYAGLVFRASIAKFSIFASAIYDYDVSKLGWKTVGHSIPQTIPVDDFNQTGFTFSVGVNYSFRNRYGI